MIKLANSKRYFNHVLRMQNMMASTMKSQVMIGNYSVADANQANE